VSAIVNILWTAGWDSTFRVADLVLNQRRPVQPWYVSTPRRRSTKRELATQQRIRDALVAMEPAAAELLAPGIVWRYDDIPADPAVTARRAALAARSTLGAQYDGLARLAQAQDVTLELCVHRDDKAQAFLAHDVTRDADGTYRLRADVTDPALRLFERFTFPLFDLTKTEMEERAAAGGFSHIMEMTWFCHAPLLDGKACGCCPPCRYTREEGLGRRVPPATPARKVQYQALDVAWRAWLKGKRLVAA